MNKKYYVAPAIAVEHVETESLCAAVSGGVSNDGTKGTFSDPVLDGDAGQACGKLQINDVWE